MVPVLMTGSSRNRLLILVAAALPLAGVARAQDMTEVGVGMPAPVVSINDLGGRPVNLGDYVGREPVFLLFWATWCEQCQALLPKVRDAARAYGDRIKFFGINVTVGETPARVREYVAKHDPPYQVLYDTEGVSQRAYGVLATAFVVIVDRRGTIVYTGYGPGQRLDEALARASGGS